MTIAIPWKGTGSRRAVAKVAELRDENVALMRRQAAADDYFAQLMADRADTYTAWRTAVYATQCAEDVIACQQLTVDELRKENAAQELRHTETVARIDKRHAETVTAMRREIDELQRRLSVGVQAQAAAAETRELDVSTVRTRVLGPAVKTLHQAFGQGRAVTNPGQTTWGVRNQAQGVA